MSLRVASEIVLSSQVKADSTWFWVGVSHNAWEDTTKDIIPLQLIQDDIDRQAKAIADGKLKDHGGLWRDHKWNKEIGRAHHRLIYPGTRLVVEAGPVATKAAEFLFGAKWPMSIGFWYTINKAAKNYRAIAVYERSVLVERSPANKLTFFQVFRRDNTSVAQLTDSLALT